MLTERDTIRIREATASGMVNESFRAADINSGLRIEFAGVFLPKHRVAQKHLLIGTI